MPIDDDERRRRTREIKDGQATFECVPLLRVGLKIDENVGIPENRIALEDEIAEKFQYVESRIFTAVRGGPATHENFVMLIKFNPAEFWSSLNRKVKSFKEWAEDDPRIDRVGRDVSVLIEAGDPNTMIAELEEGFRR